jgi:hypothetical protein
LASARSDQRQPCSFRLYSFVILNLFKIAHEIIL